MNLARGLPEGFSGLPEKRLSEAEALEDIAVFSTCQPETYLSPPPVEFRILVPLLQRKLALAKGLGSMNQTPPRRPTLR